MDPLSITAAAITFLTFSGESAKGIRRLIHDATHAPREIIATSNQICDLNVVVADLEATSLSMAQSPSSSQLPPYFKVRLEGHLHKAREKISILEELVNEVYTTSPGTVPKFQRYKWVRKKSLALSLVKDLAEVKRDLRLLLGSIAVVQNVQIQMSLTSIQQGPSCNVIQSTNEDGDNESFNTASYNINANPIAFGGGESCSARASTEGSSSTSQFSHPSEAIAKLMETVRQIGQFGTINLQLHRIVRCDGSCTCDCHSRTFLYSPQILNGILGNLFVGFAGLPAWKRKCDVSSCMNQYTRTMQVSYTFPNWLLQRTVHMAFGMTQMNEPCFAVKIKHRVSDKGENNILQLARGGHTDGIIELFRNRQASPNDVSSVAGYTPIHFATELGHSETIKFLIDAGVDPFSPDDHGGNDAIAVSELVLAPRRRYPSDSVLGLQEVFRKMKTAHDEIWDFSTLHRIVLKDLHVDLEEALIHPDRRAELNAVDIKRRTPLIWAAMRGDVEAVRLLLNAGADITIKDDWGVYPLSAGIMSGNCQCVELLILAGANINIRDPVGHNALHMASWGVDDPDILKLFVLAGASVNSSNYHGETALQSCACLNHHLNGTYLVSMGVDLDSQDDNLDTPLLEAVRYDAPEMVQILMSNGADYTCANKQGDTLLHLAAMYSTTRCLNVLASFDLHNINVAARNIDGRTAAEAFEDRVFKPEGFEDAFRGLLSNIASYPQGGDSEEEEQDNEEQDDVFWNTNEFPG